MKKFLSYLALLFIVPAYGQIDFTVTPESGCAQLDVELNFNGNPAGIEYLYFDLGEGDELTGTVTETYNFTFPNIGTRTIVMYAFDVNDSLLGFNSHTVEITGASIGISATVAGINDVLDFTLSGDATSVSWNFGDGASSTDLNPTHSYTQSGTYDVEATVESASCGTQVLSLTVDVLDFTFTFTPEAACVPEAVSFAYTGNVADIAFYYWDFGDGNDDFGTNTNLIHTYVQSGNFTITLTLFDGAFGTIGTLSKEISISGITFTPSLLITSIGQEISFESGGITSGGASWTFGDGNTSTESNPTHSYAAAGDYDVTLTAESPLCGTQTLIQTISIVDMAVTANIAAGCALPANVDFTVSTPLAVAFYAWDFGDDSTAFVQENTTAHEYLNDGSYTATVTLFDDFFNVIGTVIKEINIGATIAASNEFPKTGENVGFIVNGNHTSVSWTFGDGGTSTDSEPTHSYSTFGDYTVTATIETADCGTLTRTINISIKDVSFTVQNPGGCAPVSVTMSYSGTDTDGVLFNWDFGDGQELFGPADTVSHSYETPGVYIIEMVAFNSAFEVIGFDTSSVTIDAGSASFKLSHTGTYNLCEGDSVVLTSGMTTDLVWSTTETTTSITVKEAGTFSAVSNNPDCPSKSDTVIVVVVPLPAIDAGQDLSVCEGDSIVLTGAGGVTYSWNNGVVDGEKFLPADTVTYTLTGTDVNMCSNTDQVTISVAPCASLFENSKLLIEIYPNPARDQLQVSLDQAATKISITDVLGRTRLSQKAEFNNNIDVSNLPAGTYVVQIIGQQDEIMKTKQFVIVK